MAVKPQETQKTQPERDPREKHDQTDPSRPQGQHHQTAGQGQRDAADKDMDRDAEFPKKDDKHRTNNPRQEQQPNQRDDGGRCG